MNFEQQLAWGRTGESIVARFFQARGHSVLPVYEKLLDEGKGPQLFSLSENLIAPDMLAIRNAKACWVEAKRKTAFTWHRLSQRWTTGIDLRHYLDYLKVEDSTGFHVWLFFLQQAGRSKDSPEGGPQGLFGNSLRFLRQHENHRSENWGRTGMVYWAVESLNRFASLEELQNLNA